MRRLLFFLFLVSQVCYSQQITHVEYWFENGFANRVLQPITTNANNETDLNIPFPDNGTNEINDFVYCRFLDSNNNWSSIYSQQMNNPNDTYAYLIQMEYWFDNDFANRAIVLPTQFMGTNGLDHQEADVPWQSNAQTIHYRFKSKYNQWSSIQSSNIDNIENINNRIASAESWLNDDFASRQTVNNVAENNSFFLDIRNLILNTDVQETIHLRYKDKMNRYSSIYSFHSDYQGEQIEPSPAGSINLVTSKLPAGKVNLTWNSVENGKLYLIYRDGIYWRSLENTHHPQNLEATDFPPLGNHTYYVVAKNYLNPISITSNTDDETIDQEDIDAQNDPANTILYGTLNGMITDANGNRIDDVLITYSHDGYSVYSNLGQFKRDGILYGTQGSITLSKSGFSFTPVINTNYNIDKPLQTLAFIGTSTNTTNPIEDTQVFALEQSSSFSVLSSNPEFKQPFESFVKIKNVGTIPWSGKIQLVANKTASLVYNPNYIIDEMQVSNLAVGEERILEFKTSQLELSPDNYDMKLLAYRFENDINSTIQDIKIGTNVILLNTFTVNNSLNFTTLEEALDMVEYAVGYSQIFLGTLNAYGSNGEVLDDIIGNLKDYLETTADYASKANQIVTAINNVNALMTGNDFKDYWKALRGFTDYCDTGLCGAIGIYMDVSSQALDQIDAIENLAYSSQANFNFLENKKLELKIYKKKFLVPGFNEYYSNSDFVNQIQTASFIGLNSAGIIMDDFPLSKVVCDNSADTETLCLVPPPLDYYYMEPGYKYLVKIIWANGKITYVPFGTAYFDEDTDGNFEFKLNASKAGSNIDNIKVFAQPIFN